MTGWLSQYIPDCVCYAEVFSGAGHLLFSKRPSPVEVLNDVDNSLISFFRVIKNAEKRSKLVETLEYMPYSRALWQDIRCRRKDGDLPGDEVERAAEWFYLNRAFFGGDQRTSGFAAPSVTGRNPAASYQSAIDGFAHVTNRLRGVTVECLDYADCIRRYDSETTLFYCDPPYMGVEHFYGNGFGSEDHDRLAELLHGIKGRAMVSHYQNRLYDDLYRGWQRYEYQSFKGSHKAESGAEKPVTTEILYTSFEPFAGRSLFDAVVLE